MNDSYLNLWQQRSTTPVREAKITRGIPLSRYPFTLLPFGRPVAPSRGRHRERSPAPPLTNGKRLATRTRFLAVSFAPRRSASTAAAFLQRPRPAERVRLRQNQTGNRSTDPSMHLTIKRSNHQFVNPFNRQFITPSIDGSAPQPLNARNLVRYSMPNRYKLDI